jgi:hypothetical protein
MTLDHGPGFAFRSGTVNFGTHDRRHYPRLRAEMLWRSAGLRAPQRPVADVSLGGARVYSDELVHVGARLELQLLLPQGVPIDLFARVVRVHILPPSGPAFCDVALEFLAMSDEARTLLGRALPLPASEPRVEEQHEAEVEDVEDQHHEERLLEPPARISLACGPDGDRHICKQNREEDELLHRPWP